MDFYQFIVRARTVRQARKGILLASIILFLISFLIGGVVLSSLHTLPKNIASINVLPYILYASGNSILGRYGVIFMAPIIFVAIGSLSGILKAISQSIYDFVNTKYFLPKYVLNGLILLISFLISLTNSSIIQLIVSFYALYIASVSIPFLCYFLQKKKIIKLSPATFFLVLVIGFITSGVVLLIHTFILTKLVLNNISLLMIFIGFISSGIVVIGSEVFRNYHNIT